MPPKRVGEMEVMSDLLFIAIILVFFAVCVAYVRGLDRLVRASEEAEATHEVLS
jgi:hypothetical protein